MNKIFNRFFTTKPPGEGTGLGLSLSHDIVVKQHAGSIEVDTRPGEFAEFSITLPRTRAPTITGVGDSGSAPGGALQTGRLPAEKGERLIRLGSSLPPK